MSLVPVRQDVEYGLDGEGGAIPDGKNPGGILTSIWERVRPGPQAQLGSLLDSLRLMSEG